MMNIFKANSTSGHESIVDVVSLKETSRNDPELGASSSNRGTDKASKSKSKPKSFSTSNATGPDRIGSGNHISIYSVMTTEDEENEQQKLRQQDNSTQEGNNSIVSTLLHFHLWKNTTVIMGLILVLGIISSAALLSIGITSAHSQQRVQFERNAEDLVKTVHVQFQEYVTAASLVHNYCSSTDFDRSDFRQLYEYLVDAGLEFKAVQFDPNVTRAQRPAFEQEAREYYAENYPHFTYKGFVGFEDGPTSPTSSRSEQDYYFPIHYMEPIIGNENAIDLDYNSHVSRRASLTYSLDNGRPAVTERLLLVQDLEFNDRCGAAGDQSFGVVLFHPGVNTTIQSKSNETWPKDVASIVICIPSLLGSAVEGQNVHSAVYLYDMAGPTTIVQGSDSEERSFLGAVVADGKTDDLQFLGGASVDSLKRHRLHYAEEISVANRKWLVVLIPSNGEYEPNLIFVVVGGVITFLASAFLAFWVMTTTRRVEHFNNLRSQNEAEKASLILENARQATRAERELNDFIGHEVRNPVSAAMTACSFVKAAVNKPNPMADAASRTSVKEDVEIIDNSLKFVNDLLRNMLDMHRAANKQLKVKMVPTDVLHDVLEPVGGMLHQRNSRFEVLVECPDNLFIMADSLRLKQVVLNLGRNSCKFISEGFIRLRAAEVDGIVQLTVDDSGCGIPEEKRDKIFSKFQESLDVLSQGTGIGLFLCKNLTELMGGKIYLDENYNSGIEGNPGTRFIIDMQAPAIDPPMETGSQFSRKSAPLATLTATGEIRDASGAFTDGALAVQMQELPTACSVLFVDDDSILRKLFCRSIKSVSPDWRVREAASGEAALRLLESGEKFDLIFVDMYMASVEKQLLGTETVVEMRSRGIDCRICGLSANDKEREFLEAGANAFSFKPFPCEKSALREELWRVLFIGTESTTDSD